MNARSFQFTLKHALITMALLCALFAGIAQAGVLAGAFLGLILGVTLSGLEVPLKDTGPIGAAFRNALR